MAKQKIEVGSHQADPKYRITVLNNGPYLVYGRPPLALQFIIPNEIGESYRFGEGRRFELTDEPTSLCRCGGSHKQPFCDGTHRHRKWNGRLTADRNGLLDNIDITSGEHISITDNKSFCVFARFCDANQGVWQLTESDYDPHARHLAIRAASMCPSGRLMAWDNDADRPYEFRYDPSLAIIEDVWVGASGGLWVRGGITIAREDGQTYEVRNRSVLCRCGESANKPYCDGTHASSHWNDHIETSAERERILEKV